MGGNEMRKHALRRYVVFRIKAMEFFDINAMWQALQKGQFLPETPVHRTGTDFAAALRTVQLSWMAVFIDKNGMNVIELWKEVFPRYKVEIDQVWARIAPAWRVLRSFRDRAGFHADKPPAFFRARKDILVHRHAINLALEEFHKLFRLFLKAEATELPDLEDAVDGLLDELEDNPTHRYKRQFKKYLLIPNTRR